MTDEAPPCWTTTTLGEIGRYLNGRGFKKSEWSNTGRPIIRIQDLTGSGSGHNYFEGEAEERHVVRDGDLLMSWAATLDAFVWRGPEAVLNQHIFKVESKIDRKFHYYLLKYILPELYRSAHGSGMVHVTKPIFESFPVAIPPLEDQVAIVGEIEKQLTRIRQATRLLQRCSANLDGYVSRVLAQTLSSDEEPVLLGDVLEHLTSGSRGWAKYYADNGALFIRIGNLDHKTLSLDLKSCQYVLPPEGSETKRTRVKPGDLLISITAELGMVAVVPEDIGEAYINQHLALARLAPVVVPEYAGWYLAGRGRAQLLSRQRGATKAGLGLDDIRAISMPLPDVDQQLQLVSRVEAQLSVAQRVKLEIQTAAMRVERLHRQILTKAFSGKLLQVVDA